MIKRWKALDFYTKDHIANCLLAMPLLLVVCSPMIAIIHMALTELIK